MANRRMFSKLVIDSDDFLDMPISARLLYYDLGMRADDDGFVNPKRVMRLMGASDDDLKVLLSKGYVISFDNKVLVIRDWKINNWIRPERYTPTIYQEYLKKLQLSVVKRYCLPKGNKNVTPRVTPRVTHRLGKDSIDKNRLEKKRAKLAETDPINEIFDIFYKTVNPTINFGHKTNRAAVEFMVKKFGLNKVKKLATYACSVQGNKYAPTIVTPYQLREKMGELMVYYKKENNQSDKIPSL